MSSPVWFSIPEFTGIQQHKDGRLLPIGSAYDARNMETSDGNLSVARGFSRVIDKVVPGSGNMLKLIPVDTTWTSFYVVASNTIYMWSKTNSAWDALWDNDTIDVGGHPVSRISFSPELSTNQVDTLQVRIGSYDAILVCTGEGQAYAIYNDSGNNGYARKFGSGLYSYEGTAQSYNSGTRRVTLNSVMPDDARRRILIYGVTYGNGIHADVSSCGFNYFVLAETPTTPPAANDAVKISGGSGSDAHIAYAEMYANRLFAAGDPSTPCRLYWSAVPGDGRTIEDWGIVDGSEDASGGYVEVGDTHYDPIIGLTALSNQLLIWKKYSVWRLFGDRPSTFTLERVERDFDAISDAGVLVYHDAPYFLSADGLRTYDGVGVIPVGGGYNQIKRFFETKSPSVANSRAAFWRNRLYMSCYKFNPQTYENFLVVFDLTNGSYMIRDGFDFADIGAFGEDLFILTDDRYVCQFTDTSYTYDGSSIVAYWQTQPIDFGKKMYKHQIMGLYMHLKDGNAKIKIIGDYDGSSCEKVVTLDGPAYDDYVAARVHTDQSHVFSIRFENVPFVTPETTMSLFSICGGVNIKCLSELKE